MGYHYRYSGEIEISPALSEQDRFLLAYLIDDNNARENRDKDVFADPLPDDITAMLPDFKQQCDGWGYLPITITADGQWLNAENDMEYSITPDATATGLRFLHERFLVPRGYTMAPTRDSIGWWGDGDDDRGMIWVWHGQAEPVEDRSSNPGPSWEKREPGALVEKLKALRDYLAAESVTAEKLRVIDDAIAELADLPKLATSATVPDPTSKIGR